MKAIQTIFLKILNIQMNMEMNIGMCELQKVLEYKDWRNFQKVIDKTVLAAIIAFQAKKLGLLRTTSQ